MRCKKKIFLMLTLICLIIMPIKANAGEKDRITYGDLLDEKDAILKEKKDQEEQIAISQSEYDKIAREIIEIENYIAKLSSEIQEANKEINKLEKEIEEKKEETDNILVFLQLSNGEKSYLEYIFKAKSFTDLIHRVSVVEQMSKYNKEQIKEMNTMITKNNNLKKENEERIKKQEDKKVESNKKIKQLDSKIKTLEGEVPGIEDRLKEIEGEITRAQEGGCKKRSDRLSACSPMLTATGFLRPLESGRITSEYSWRIHPITGLLDSHSGIDIGGVSEGTPVYPVANGQVLYKVYRSSCGGNMIYIKHNVNGKQYTSVYMHLLSFGEYQPGDNVRYDDVIGYVGGGSTASYDKCTSGAHLHLTLATGHTINHRATMFNPREVIEFPTGRTYFYKRYW